MRSRYWPKCDSHVWVHMNDDSWMHIQVKSRSFLVAKTGKLYEKNGLSLSWILVSSCSFMKDLLVPRRLLRCTLRKFPMFRDVWYIETYNTMFLLRVVCVEYVFVSCTVSMYDKEKREKRKTSNGQCRSRPRRLNDGSDHSVFPTFRSWFLRATTVGRFPQASFDDAHCPLCGWPIYVFPPDTRAVPWKKREWK